MMPYCNPMLAKRKREMDTSAIYVNRVSHIFDGKDTTNHVEKGEKTAMKTKELKEVLNEMCDVAREATSDNEESYIQATEEIRKILDEYKKLKKKNKKLKAQLEEAKEDLERERNSEFECM